jgi:hypothetical protein
MSLIPRSANRDAQSFITMEVRTMKTQKDQCSSRREFLKKTIKATGYTIPAMMVFRVGSTNAWAQKYDTGSGQGGGSSDPCKGVFEKIFKTQCW